MSNTWSPKIPFHSKKQRLAQVFSPSSKELLAAFPASPSLFICDSLLIHGTLLHQAPHSHPLGQKPEQATATKEQSIHLTRTRLDIYSKKHFKHHNWLLRPHHKNKTTIDQDSRPPLESSNSTVLGSPKSNLAETHDSDFKLSIMSMIKDLKKEINNTLMKTMTTQMNEIIKSFQDTNAEFNKEKD